MNSYHQLLKGIAGCAFHLAAFTFPVNAQEATFASFASSSPKALSVVYATGKSNALPEKGSILVNRDMKYMAYTPEELLREVFLKKQGSTCLTEGAVSNVSFTGYGWDGTAWTSSERALSYFFGTKELGIESGLLLSTGSGQGAEGPNSSGKAADSGLNGGKIIMDPDLASLAGHTLGSGAILEFDFVPGSSRVSFEYIFASEEYPDYSRPVNEINDVFGFWISNPDGTNKKNIAIVPGTENIPVNVTSISEYRNQEYFINNYSNPGAYTGYNGHTRVLVATGDLIPGKAYRLKLGIANAVDNVYGSGVFLKASSLDLGLGITNHGNMVPGRDYVCGSCESNKFAINFGQRTQDGIISLSYDGTAVNDICQPDGTPMPAEIRIPANTMEINLPYRVRARVTPESGDYTLTASIPGCGTASKTIYVYSGFDSVQIHSRPAREGIDGELWVTASGGSPYLEMSIDHGDHWQKTQEPFRGLAPGSYSVIVRDSIGCQMETHLAKVGERNPFAPWSFGNEPEVAVLYKDNHLEVSADREISQIQIYGILGSCVHTQSGINSNYYSKLVPLAQGVYIVLVRTKDAATKSVKIVAL